MYLDNQLDCYRAAIHHRRLLDTCMEPVQRNHHVALVIREAASSFAEIRVSVPQAAHEA
jgi:hypothetical protein